MPFAARSPLAPPVGAEQLVWHVLAAFPTALYLHHPERGLLPLVTADALALPTAWRLPDSSTRMRWGVAAGDVIESLDHCILLPAGPVRAVRTWRPARVRRSGSYAVELPPSWAADRLGGGRGLTPEGDDEICGALLVAFAGHDTSIADAVLPQLDRTTALSASLVRAAAQGYAVPALVAYTDARLSGNRAAAGAARHAVDDIGHTSGPALIRGVEIAIAHRQIHQSPSLTKEPARA